MDLLKLHISKNFLAHGYFIEGTRAPDDIISFYFGDTPHEYIILNKEKVGIDAIRALKEKTSLISFDKKKQIVCVDARALTREAQSALLKITEEPPPHTHFFLFGDSEEMISLPLRSRLIIIRRDPYEAQEKTKEAERFFKEPAESRKKILDSYSTTQELRAFFETLSVALREDVSTQAHTRTKERFLAMHALLSMPSVSVASLKDYATYLL